MQNNTQVSYMKSYETINWEEKYPDELYQFFYEELEEEERYLFFRWLMQHFPELEIDWLELFDEFKGDLLKEDKIEELLSFSAWYKEHQPDNYSRNYGFLEKDLLDYFFFRGEIERIKERMSFIQENPVSGIDSITVRLLYQLIYHGYTDLAVSYSEAVWNPVNESEELIGFASFPFINTIFKNELQKLYEAKLNGTFYDEEKLYAKMLSMGYDEESSVLAIVSSVIKEDFSKDNIEESIRRDDPYIMLNLQMHFLKYMYDVHRMPFVFSDPFWEFVLSDKLFGQKSGKENWFYIQPKSLDQHIVKNLDTFVSSNELEIFGQVWGLDFIVEFFRHHQLVSAEQYQQMLENNFHFRGEMFRFCNSNLWQMMFVWNWSKVGNSVDETVQKQVFLDTYGKDMGDASDVINAYLSGYKVPFRLEKELKLAETKKSKPLSFGALQTPIVNQGPQIGRNDPCPCGSGKKFKKCCMD